LSQNTIKEYRRLIHKAIKAVLGTVRLEKSTPAQLDAFFASMLDKGREPGSIDHPRAPGPGRRPHEITLYKSVRIAVQDIATARLVVAAARQNGLGTDIAPSR